MWRKGPRLVQDPDITASAIFWVMDMYDSYWILWTFSIWMNATLRVKYGRLLQTRLPLYRTPIGAILRRYILLVISILRRSSRKLVVRARIWVMIDAKRRCQQVSVTAGKVTMCQSQGPPLMRQLCGDVRKPKDVVSFVRRSCKEGGAYEIRQYPTHTC